LVGFVEVLEKIGVPSKVEKHLFEEEKAFGAGADSQALFGLLKTKVAHPVLAYYTCQGDHSAHLKQTNPCFFKDLSKRVTSDLLSTHFFFKFSSTMRVSYYDQGQHGVVYAMVENDIIDHSSATYQVQFSVIFHLSRKDISVDFLQKLLVPEQPQRPSNQNPEGDGR
jgi:hypothetical protein